MKHEAWRQEKSAEDMIHTCRARRAACAASGSHLATMFYILLVILFYLTVVVEVVIEVAILVLCTQIGEDE